MELRRFKDIIAIKNDTSVGFPDSIIAFHSGNMEVAEISSESFNEMTQINLNTGEIPSEKHISDPDAFAALSDWNTEINPNVKSGKIDFGIRSITLNINQICNLKCSYCAAGGDGTYGEATSQISVEKTIPQLKYFIDSLADHSKFYISFVGGEPLLHPYAIKALHDFVVSTTESRNIKSIIKVVTNGTLLEGKTLEILRTMPIQLIISFDGIKEKNDLVRPSKDGGSTTDKILRGLEELRKDRGNIQSIELSAITSDGNDDLISNYKFLNSLGTDYIDFVFANDEKNLLTQKKYIAQMSAIAALAWGSGGEKSLRRIRVFDHYFNLLDRQQKVENHCGAGKSYLMVDAKNRLYSCVWDANDKTAVVGEGKQLDYDKISKYSKSLIELNNCQTCWARYMCGGGCMHINKSHTGNKHQKSLLFCERTRSLISTAILYYKLARAAST